MKYIYIYIYIYMVFNSYYYGTTSSSSTRHEALAINSCGNNEGSTFCSAQLKEHLNSMKTVIIHKHRQEISCVTKLFIQTSHMLIGLHAKQKNLLSFSRAEPKYLQVFDS
jgi:hypothetical protein